MEKKIKISILEDENLILEAISNLLVTKPNFEVISKYNNGNIFLKDITEESAQEIDVLILDLNMNPINGLQVLEELNNRNIQIKVLVLSSLYNATMYGYMIKYGICGFLPKYTEKEELYKAIENIYLHKFYVNEGNQVLLEQYISNQKKGQNPWSMIALSERETEILKLICLEMSTKAIAEKLYISVKTVESHRTKIMEKIGCKNVIGMVVYAILNGIFVIGEHEVIEN